MVFRIEPDGPAEAYRTYRIASRRSERRVVSCRDFGCERYERGWLTRLDVSTGPGARVAAWVRDSSGRKFTMTQEGNEVVFLFPPGQQCFELHWYAPALYVVQGGDWRGNPRGVPPRVHANIQDWVDDYAENQRQVIDRVNRG